MKSQQLTIITLIIIVLGLIVGSIGAGIYFAGKEDTPPPIIDPLDEPITGPIEVETEEFLFEDRFSIEVVEGWSLVSENQDQQVDRYRFEKRNGETSGVLTLSFYPTGDITTFDELIERRYGGAVLDLVQDLEINGKPAKRVVAGFLGNGGGVRMGTDVLIQVEDGYFISINSLHFKEGEDAALMLSQIDYMQTSFKELE